MNLLINKNIVKNFNSILINLSTWSLLIHQINTLHQLRNNTRYIECKNLVKSKEVSAIKWFAIISCIYLLFSFSLYLLLNFIKSNNHEIKIVIHLKYICWEITLLIISWVLFKKLYATMRNNLNHYFIKKWRNVKFIFITGFAYLGFKIILNFFFIMFQNEEINGLSIHFKNDYVGILYLWLLLIWYMLKFIYSMNKFWQLINFIFNIAKLIIYDFLFNS